MKQPSQDHAKSRLHEIAAMCGSAAMIIGVALIINSASVLKQSPSPSQPARASSAMQGFQNAFAPGSALAAATWLATQQGVPGYGGYPRPSTCYSYATSQTIRNYNNYPPCAGQGGMNGNVAVFSIHPAGVADGYSQVFVPNNNYYLLYWGFSSYGVGTPPTVGSGAPVVLEWSCQPNQVTISTKCSLFCFNTYEQSQNWLFFPSGEPTYGGTTGSVTVYPTSNTTYTLSCTSGRGGGGQGGGGGLTVAASLPVYVNQPSVPAPTANITSTKTAMRVGQTATIHATFTAGAGDTLTHTNIDSPEGHGLVDWDTAGSKTYTFTPTTQGIYTFYARATSSGHPSTATYDTVQVNVTRVPSQCTGSECTFTKTPSTPVLPGDDVKLTWSCNPNIYTGSQGDTHFSTGGALAGDTTVNPEETTTYTLSCTVGGERTIATVTVTVLQPSLTITANPIRVLAGTNTTIVWSATNVLPNTCKVISNPTGSTWGGSNGSQSATISAPTQFTLTCKVPARTLSNSVTVTLIPSIIER